MSPDVQWLLSDHLTTMNLQIATTEHLMGAVWVWASCLSGYLIQNKLQITTVSSACLQPYTTATINGLHVCMVWMGTSLTVPF